MYRSLISPVYNIRIVKHAMLWVLDVKIVVLDDVCNNICRDVYQCVDVDFEGNNQRVAL